MFSPGAGACPAHYIASLCAIHGLKLAGRHPAERQICAQRCTIPLPQTVLLDANALLMPFQFPMNLEAEIRRLFGDADVAVPTPVLEEVRLLATHDRAARAAAQLARRYRAVEARGSADDALLDLGQSLRAVVVTNDRPLLRRLRAAGIPRAFLRSRSHLVAEGL